MRLIPSTILAWLCLPASLLPFVSADRMIVVLTQVALVKDYYTGVFYTDHGEYGIDPSPGCRGTKVPGMVEFCVDYGQRRVHFRFSHQSDKRCMRMTEIEDISPAPKPGDNVLTGYIRMLFEEASCNWRRRDLSSDGSGSNATESVASESAVADTEVPATTLVRVARRVAE